MNVSDAIAQFVTSVTTDEIPARARQQAVMVMLDNYALAFAGATERSTSVIREATRRWATDGPCWIAGSRERADACTAALVNGAAMHALDYDAMSYAVFGFTGSAITAALAVRADADRDVSGTDVVTALCVGWEVGAALGRAVNPSHYAKGWHPTATLALFAATCALCRIRGFTTTQVKAALSVAVSEASGVKTMIGNMVNPYHVGKAARNAVVATELAVSGFVGHDDPLGAKYGFLNLFQGPGNYDATAITETLGRTYDLVSPGAAFKVYPCCGLIHSGLDAIYNLKAEHGIDPAEIAAVRLQVHEYVPEVMHIQEPVTGYAAKFSIPYCIALALRNERIGIDSFSKVDPSVVELGRRVTVEIHPDLRGGDTVWVREFINVEIQTGSGDRFSAKVRRLDNKGVGPDAPLAEMRHKFNDCLAAANRAGLTVPEDAAQAWGRLLAADCDQRWSLWGDF